MGDPQKTNDERRSVSLAARVRGIGQSAFPRTAGGQKPINKERLLFQFFVLDILFFFLRLAVATISDSMAMFTTVAKAAISILTAFIAWLTFRFVTKDESGRYDYGYGKIESISSIVRAAALLISFIIIIYTAIGRIGNPVPMKLFGAEIAIAFAFLFTCGNIYRWFRLRRILATDSRSPLFQSQFKATNASIIVNAGTLLSVSLSLLLAGYSWAAYIDPVMSVLLSGFILIFAYSILSNSMTDLLDKALDESMQLHIVRALAEFFDEYTQILGVRSRRSGGEIFVEIELEFDADRNMGDVQSVVDRMKSSLEAKIQNSRITIVPRSAAQDGSLAAEAPLVKV